MTEGEEGGGGAATAEGFDPGELIDGDGGGAQHGTDGQEDAEGAQGEEHGGEGQQRQQQVGQRGQQRFQHLANELKAEKAARLNMEERLRRYETPAQQLQEEQRKRQRWQEFSQRPLDFLESDMDRREQDIRQWVEERDDQREFRSMLETLRSSSLWSEDLNLSMGQAMREISQDLNLTPEQAIQKHGRSKLLRMAYRQATGKPWGEWSKDGYQTRLTKERLMRPAAGGGSGRGGTMSDEEFAAVPAAEFEKNPAKYIAMNDAWHKANAGR